MLLLALVSTIGCARMMADQTGALMIRTAPAVEMEEDPIIAEAATVSNLKMIEGLLIVSPENEDLLATMTKAFAGYGSAFIEPDWSLRDDFFSDDYLATRKRLQSLYRRSRDTGLRWIAVRDERLATLLRATRNSDWVDELPGALARTNADDVPSMFWTAQAWGLLIRADDENLLELANRGKIDALMNRVYELDPDYNYGTVHLFYALTGTTLGEEFGGDLDDAKAHFEAAVAVTDGRFFPPRFFYARDYCRAIQDRQCYVDGLTELAEADPDAFPEQRLANTLAVGWAREWLSKADSLF